MTQQCEGEPASLLEQHDRALVFWRGELVRLDERDPLLVAQIVQLREQERQLQARSQQLVAEHQALQERRHECQRQLAAAEQIRRVLQSVQQGKPESLGGKVRNACRDNGNRADISAHGAEGQ